MENERLHFCPNCGYELQENARFCPNCGYDLRTIQSEPMTRKNRYQANESIPETSKPKSGKKAGLIMSILGILVIILGIGAWFVLTEGNKVSGGDEQQATVSSSTSSTSQSEDQDSSEDSSTSSDTQSEKLIVSDLTPEEAASAIVAYGSDQINNSDDDLWTGVWDTAATSGMTVYINNFDEVSDDSLSNPGENNVLYTIKLASGDTNRLFYTLNDGQVYYYTGRYVQRKYHFDYDGAAVGQASLKRVVHEVNQDADLLKTVKEANPVIEDDR